MLRVLDLFSGIGGFSLGLERAGMKTVAFCEIEPFCRKVLKKHWPKVPIYEDVRELTAARLASDGIGVDVICGGFPCQDISVAGKGAGIDGERSGLWREYARLIGELRPQYVIVENVAALLGRGLSRVLGDLAQIGYDAEWHCIPASYVGAPHRRDRLWIVAYPMCGSGSSEFREQQGQRTEITDSGCKGEVAHSVGQLAKRNQLRPHIEALARAGWGFAVKPNGKAIPHATSPRQPGQGVPLYASHQEKDGCRETVDAFYGCLRGQWETEPNVGRVANGVPSRVDRLKGLGNAVVPQVVEIIGKAIINAHN